MDAPRRFGDYILLERLGQGGMGDVWLARQDGFAGIGKMCVVKSIKPTLGADREYKERFIDEARVVVELSHRNVCQVFDVGEVAGQLYLAMELIAGRDLKRVADAAGALPAPIALHIVGEVLDALDYAHRKTDPRTGAALGLVHRDVSPQNIMITFEGETKLIDFGLARSSLKRHMTEPGIVLGKIAYMSGEQARAEAVDARSDQFAAAVICYELLAGERYYQGFTGDELWRIVGDPRALFRPRRFDTVSPGVRAVLDRALSADASARFESCEAFRRALLDVQMREHTIATLSEVRAFVTHLFGNEVDDERRHRAELAELKVAASGTPPAVRIATSTSLVRMPAVDPGAPTAALDPMRHTAAVDPGAPTLISARRGTSTAATKRSLLPFAAAGGLLFVTALAALVAVMNAEAPPRAAPSPPVASAPAASPPSPTPPPSPLDTREAVAPVALPATPEARPPMRPAPASSPMPPPGDAQTVNKVEPAPSPPPAPAPSPVRPPAPPRLLNDKLAYLKAHCGREGCTRAVRSRFRGYEAMATAELRDLARDVDACIAVCRR